MHDQTLRLPNKGYVGSEIAEQLTLPPTLAREWHTRGYYGTLSHNAKGVYQRYIGWFDGNPAHLWSHPPEQAATRYIERWAAPMRCWRRPAAHSPPVTIAGWPSCGNHAVFADPANLQARELEAQALEQLAYGAESAPWRAFFLMGAQELREGVREGGNTPSREMVALLSTEQLFDVLAIRIDGPRAGELRLSFNWIFTDTDEHHVLMLSNGVLIHSANRQDPQADATVLVERAALNELFAGITPVGELLGTGRLRVEGDAPKLGELLGLLDEPDPSFAIVTP